MTGSGGTAETLQLDYLPNTTAKGEVTISVLAKTGGESVDGETLYFNIDPNESGGSLDVFSAVTVNGVATVTYTAGIFEDLDPAPPGDGQTIDEITVTTGSASTDTGITETATITILPPGIDVTSVEVSSSVDTLEAVAVGNNQAIIEALVKDNNGNVMVGIEVDFTTTAGTICGVPAPVLLCNEDQPFTVETLANGKARITLQSSTNLETAKVTATTANSGGV